jgi:hypothetical protein
VDKKISESILQQKWPRNNFDIEKYPYNSHLLAYNKEMDWLVSANSLIASEVEELSSPTCLKYGMMKRKPYLWFQYAQKT